MSGLEVHGKVKTSGLRVLGFWGLGFRAKGFVLSF